ncbi:MAG: hypothetical protein JWR18_1640 [Segetibacter sp.]|jgi:hypothetical protein|nr:hypothetical protein [Segetibacter sp.]
MENSKINGVTDLLATQKLLEKSKPEKKKNRSAIAASVARSAVKHASAHRLSNKPGDFAHSGTHISYEN